MANQTNQTNKIPVLFVQPFADDMTMDKALNWAGMKTPEDKKQAAAMVRGLLRNPAAAMAEDRRVFGGYFAGAGMICEAVAELLQENKDKEQQEQFADDGEVLGEAASLFYGAACFVNSPKFVAKAVAKEGYSFPFVVTAIQSPNKFTQNDYAAIDAVLEKAQQTIRILQDDAGLQEVFADDFTGDDYAEAEALIGLIKAALPLPREIMENRGEYYADENGGEA